MSTKRRTYTELKLEVVKRALSGESVKAIAYHFGITDTDYIYKWMDHMKCTGK
ncbi:transposase [Saccharococcus caldoxylosilyticus]|uniref:Insertion element IS150 protein InsJ-like helix-turn-helix domain-containing protein n=1 Tax=Saccharococcus caldoxylosilyticus TaxID=81408 RepID=A0A150LQC8_9BACL|nr:helix-turn-helix domain-containing protein [Parageobacillus caldoxylosilyticus]KYD14493.1 hypothetical protein B4119_1543 [Parageobacillus caldoxylosilyticus]